MTTKDEVLKQALEALQRDGWKKAGDAIRALKEALAEQPAPQPEQEPVVCQYAKDVAMPEYRCAGKCQYAQPEQEPVAWANEIIDDLHAQYNTDGIKEIDSGDALIRLDEAIAAVEEAEKRHTAPPQRKPLTDEQITVLNFMLGADDMDGVWFGEQHPKEEGAFWWRNLLRNAFQDAAIEAKLREKNT